MTARSEPCQTLQRCSRNCAAASAVTKHDSLNCTVQYVWIARNLQHDRCFEFCTPWPEMYTSRDNLTVPCGKLCHHV